MLFANNCNTTLASSLTSGATSMSVTSATGFPSPTGVQYFYCTLADAATQTTIEIVKVTSVTGTTFAITRGQDGTTGTAFAAGAVVSLRLVRASLNDFPKLSETNTFNADQSIVGALTTSAGLVSTNTFTATPPSDGLVMDYATGFGRFSAFAGDGFQWYNAGVANTKLMQLSSTGVITTATWNGATVTVPYGGTGLTSLTAGYIPYGNGTSAFSSSSNLFWDGANSRLGIGTSSPSAPLTVNGQSSLGGASQQLGIYQDGAGISIEAFQTGTPATKKNFWLAAYGGNVNIGTTTSQGLLTLNGSYANIGSYSSTYHIDSSYPTLSIANGGTVDFSNFSGMIIANNNSAGGVTIYICGGGGTTAVASQGTQVGTLAYNSGVAGYRWTNNSGSTIIVTFCIIRTRNTA